MNFSICVICKIESCTLLKILMIVLLIVLFDIFFNIMLMIKVSQLRIVIDNVVRHILQYNADDKGKPVEDRKPILLYCSSNGGEIDPGFELVDVILQSNTPVYTINLGYQYSMGFLIGLAGHKRYASKTAKFLMHDGTNFVINSGAKAQDQMEFNKRIEQRIKEYVLAQTKITSEMYDAQMRKEWYMFADEAKNLGVTDYIIGEDCNLDEIL